MLLLTFTFFAVDDVRGAAALDSNAGLRFGRSFVRGGSGSTVACRKLPSNSRFRRIPDVDASSKCPERPTIRLEDCLAFLDEALPFNMDATALFDADFARLASDPVLIALDTLAADLTVALLEISLPNLLDVVLDVCGCCRKVTRKNIEGTMSSITCNKGTIHKFAHWVFQSEIYLL